MKNMVWVELNDLGQAVRIFRTDKARWAFPGFAILIRYSTAVSEIRHLLYLRSNGMCELCTSAVTETSGHMHEQQHRGKGGEISLDNSVFICPKCHQDAHSDRTPQWSKKI
jgi:hypothetical protein